MSDMLNFSELFAAPVLNGDVSSSDKILKVRNTNRDRSSVLVHHKRKAVPNFNLRCFFREYAIPHCWPSPRRLGCGSGNLKHRSINRVNRSFVENLIGSPRAVIFPSAREQGAGRLTLAPASPLQPLSPPGLL